MIKPANKTTLYEDVIKQIIDMIKRSDWTPNMRIPGEFELAKMFQVSRNCMREALKALELSGVINARIGKGTFVANDALSIIHNMELLWLLRDDSSMVELVETRLLIEPQLAYIAAQRATPEDVDRLLAMVESSKEAANKGNYTMKIGFEFHMAIAHLSGNRVLVKFLDSIADQLIAQRGMLFIKHLSKNELLRELEEHRALCSYIRKKEADKAREVMYKHLSNAKLILTEDELKRSNRLR